MTKKGRTCITTLWCHVHDHLAKLFIIHRELLVFFSEMSRVLLQGHKLLRLGARYWLGAPNGWDTTGRQQGLGRSVGELVHLIFIGVHRTILPLSTNLDRNSDGSKNRPHISPSIGYYRSSENEKRNHHVQFKENNNLRKKWLNEQTIKCWARLTMNCCTPFWPSSLCTCVFTNSSIGLGSRPRDLACKKKKN
jgi:hypothetical protein